MPVSSSGYHMSGRVGWTPPPTCGESYSRREAELPVGPEVDLAEAGAAMLPAASTPHPDLLHRREPKALLPGPL